MRSRSVGSSSTSLPEKAGLAAALPGCLIIGGLLPLGAAFWWPLELLSHFRVQYLALALMVLVITIVTRRFFLGAALLAVMFANTLPLLPYTPLAGRTAVPASAPAAAAGIDTPGNPVGSQVPGAVSVLNLNVNASNPEHEQILATLRASDADVIMLVELSHRLAARIASIADDYPYQALFPEDGNFGIGMLSRMPLTAAASFELGPTTALEARVATGEGSVTLVAVHTLPPVNAEMAAARNSQLSALAERAKQRDGALVICGDLNLTPYSPWFIRLLRESGTTDTRAGRWPGFSWPVKLPLLGIPIDHCLIRGKLTTTDIKRLNSVGSDHYPVLVSLAWQPEQ